MKISLAASRGQSVNCLTALFNVASWNHTTPPTLSQHVCPPSLSPHPSSTHHMYSSCPLRLLCSRSSFLYMLLILHWRCSHFFCLVLHCVSVSGVTSVVLPYGRWHHAVLPQGRTTDGMLGGVCVRSSVSPYPPINPKQRGRGLGSAWFWCCGWWWYCWWPSFSLTRILTQSVVSFYSALCIYLPFVCFVFI